jgi:hypothetical protein
MDKIDLVKGDIRLEELVQNLNDENFLKDYKAQYDNYKVSLLPKLLGKLLVFCGNVIYGRKPSVLKFRSVEIIARVPYYSWVASSFTLMTLFFSNEEKALKYSNVARFAQFAQENETMHVVVISHMASLERKAGFIRFSLIPMLFAFFYYWMSYILFFLNPRYSYELNYMFESHAFDQYDRFLKLYEPELKSKHCHSKFLDWYGRYPRSQYDFFLSVRNDEIIHRNNSIEEIKKLKTH